MERNERYVYQALFTKSEDAIEVSFPDLPGVNTFGSDMEEAIEMAKDALEQYLLACEDLGINPPEPSDLGSIKTAVNESIYVVDVWMPLLRDKENNRAIKKTLTIPKWLNDMAIKQGVNFSHVLQAGLKAAMGIK